MSATEFVHICSRLARAEVAYQRAPTPANLWAVREAVTAMRDVGIDVAMPDPNRESVEFVNLCNALAMSEAAYREDPTAESLAAVIRAGRAVRDAGRT